MQPARMRTVSVVGLMGLLFFEAFAHGEGNDNFADRLTLSGGTAAAVANFNSATAEAGEPGHAGVPPRRSLWWTWTAPTTGSVNLSAYGSTEGEGWIRIAAYTGTGFADLSEVGSNNNSAQSFSTTPAETSFDISVTAGSTYQIAIDQPYETSSGIFALSLNQRPTITSSATAIGTFASSFTYQIAASNRPTRFLASGLPLGLSLNSSSGLISGKILEQGSFTIALSAENAHGVTSGVLMLAVRDQSPPPPVPVILASAGERGILGDTLTYFISASGLPTSYTATNLPPGLSLNPGSGTITGVPTAAGTYQVSVSATNVSGTGNALVVFVIEPGPELPLIDSYAQIKTTVGASIFYTISTQYFSGVGKSTQYDASDLPPGLSIDRSTGVISGAATQTGTFVVPLSATNVRGTGTARLTIIVAAVDTGAATPGPLLITCDATTKGTVGTAFTFLVATSGGPTSFTAVGLPPGLSINAQSGYITGTPTRAGTSSPVIRASNASESVEATLTITITQTADSGLGSAVLVVRSRASMAAFVGVPFSHQVSAQAAGTSQFFSASYSAVALPPGLSMTSAGAISGTPASSGTYLVELTINGSSNPGGGVNASGTAVLTIVVYPSENFVGKTPLLTSQSRVAGTVGSHLSYNLAAANQPVSFSSGLLPDGLTLNTSTGSISGAPTASGIFTVPVSATNPYGTGSGEVLIVISPPDVPTISTDAAARATVGSSFSLWISASGSITSYNASDLPPGLTINQTNGLISGTPAQTGVYRVPVAATNSAGTANAVVTVTVEPVAPPRIIGSLAASGIVGEYFFKNVYGNGTGLGYSASGLPAGLAMSSDGNITGTPTAAGKFPVTITATNSAGSTSAILTITVTPSGLTPVITSRAAINGSIGSTFSHTITSSPSGTTFAATGLPGGLSLNPATGTISGTPSANGVSTVPISATRSGVTGSATLTIIVGEPLSSEPVITSAAGARGVRGGIFSYTINASNSPATFEASGLPTGLSLNSSTGLISGKPVNAGRHSTIIQARNSTGLATATLTVNVDENPYSAPVLTSPAGSTARVNESFFHALTATNRPTSFFATNLPPGVTLDPATGVISGRITASGVYTVSIGATNTVGTSTASIRLMVGAAISGLKITSAAGASAVLGGAFSYQITSAGSPTSYSAASLPPGLAINTTTGAITGSPTSTGTFAVTIGAAAGFSNSASAVLTIQVSPSSNSSAPTITSSAAASSFAGEDVGYLITTAVSAQVFSATNLPSGLSFDAARGVIFGVPTAVGTFTIPISATNGGVTRNATLTLRVGSPVQTPRISSSAAVAGTLGIPFRYRATALGVSSSPGITTSTLPPGLTLNSSTREITGTPIAPGSYNVTVSIASTATAVVAIRIDGPNSAPPAITSAAQEVAYLNAEYSYSIQTSHAASAYSVGTLPAGLSFDAASGTIFGRPQDAGRHLIQLEAGNSLGAAQAVLSLDVKTAQPLPVITSKAVATIAVGKFGIAYTITATNSPESFTAAGLPPGLSLDPYSGVISGKPLEGGEYVTAFSAFNGAGTTTAVVKFVISAGPALPDFASFSNDAADHGAVAEYFSYTLSATNATAYEASGLPPGLSLKGSTGSISGTPTASGVFVVPVSATNASGTVSATLTIYIESQRLPRLSSYDATVSGKVGGSLTMFGSLMNAASGVIFAASGLPPGLAIDQEGDVRGVPTTSGIFTAIISATNAVGSDQVEVVFQISGLTAPTLSTPLGVAGEVDSSVSVSPSASGSGLQYSASGLPLGMAVNQASGVISGTPMQTGRFVVELTAANSLGNAVSRIQFDVANPLTANPLITSAASTAALFGGTTFSSFPASAFSYQITSTGAQATYAASGLPVGLSLNPALGLITGTPVSAGTYRVLVTAANAGGEGSAVITFIVSGSAPVMSGPANVPAVKGTLLNYSLNPADYSFSSSEKPVFPVSYTATGLPPGLSLNSASGLISGRPTVAGMFPVRVNAGNAAGTTVAVITFIVRPEAPVGGGGVATQPLLTSSEASAIGAVGVPFSMSLSGPVGLATYSSQGLPAGLFIEPNSGTFNGQPATFARIKGVPTDAGTYLVPVTVTNSAGSTGVLLTLVINEHGPAPVIGSDAGARATVGVAFFYPVLVNYDPTTSYGAATVGAGTLPPGLRFNSTSGWIEGTPEVTGTFLIPLTASYGAATSAGFLTLVIDQPAPPLTLPSIAARVGELAFVGVPFTARLGADAAPSSLQATSLPPGLTLGVSDATSNGVASKSGTIAGIPTTEGIFTVPVSSTNALGTSSAVMTIRVVAPQFAPPVIRTSPADRTTPAGSQITLSVDAVGSPTLTYQWLKGEVPIASANTSSLILHSAQLSDAGSYRVRVSNGAGSATSQPAQIIVTTTFEAWQNAHFDAQELASGLADAQADFNGDGVLNLMEYAFARNPKNGSGGSLPGYSRNVTGDRMRVHFVRDPGKPDITYTVEKSANLSGWEAIARSSNGAATASLGAAGSITESGGILKEVTVEEGQASSGAGSRFMRVRISRP